MCKIIILKGLPASGKSTWAKEQKGYKRVNKDDLRAMLDNSFHSKGNESFVVKVRDAIIREACAAEKNIIVDDTNFNKIHEINIREIAAEFNASVEVKMFDTPLADCILRDAMREKPVGEEVIRGMYNQYIAGEKKYHDTLGLQSAIICDLDGTLATIGDRNAYDAKNCHVDTINKSVMDIVEYYYDRGLKVFLFSGRDGTYRKETEDWLQLSNVPYYKLVMRNQGDKRKDSIIKEEFFNEHINGRYNVRCVLDDRLQVCRMWHKMGLPLLRVGDPDSNF